MAVEVTAHKVKGSAFSTTISSTLTKVPGLKNLKLNMGENKTVEIADLDSSYEAPFDVDLTGAQGATFDLIYDPLGAAHQDLAKQKNERTTRAGRITLGTTGVLLAIPSFFVKKFDVDLEVGNAMMASVEVSFMELLELAEVDPA
jgi:hypothetical protein